MKIIKDKNKNNEKKIKAKKKSKTKDPLLFKKRVKVITIICILVIAIELFIMYVMYLNRDSKLTFVDTLNSIHNVDDSYYLASGSSNFKYSRYNDSFIYQYEDLNTEDLELKQAYAEQAKLVKYDKELNIVFESTFNGGEYDSTFYDAIVANDYIYAVGSYIYDESQVSLKTRDAILVKYDLDGKIEWFRNYQILGDTEFKKIIAVDDGLIVVGQSIYENMEIGNHDMGGGIIVKYDFDGNIIWTNNFGGNKSGIFNDVVEVEDGYICCGKDAVNYGLIVKFSLDGERIWVKNYSNTDEIGMTAIKVKDDKIYIAGSYNKSESSDDEGNKLFEYDACIFIYSLDGELIDIFSIGGSLADRFNSLLLNDNSIIAIGYTKSSDIELSGLGYKEKMAEGMIVEFDYQGHIINSKVYGGSKNETLNDIVRSIPTTEELINNTQSYILIGYTNSRRNIFQGNGKDYFGKVLKYSAKFELEREN